MKRLTPLFKRKMKQLAHHRDHTLPEGFKMIGG